MSQFFWLFCGLWCGVGNAVAILVRRRAYTERGRLKDAEVTAFAKGTALWILLPCLLLWGLQMSIGRDVGPMYTKWPDPQRILAFGLQAAVWIALAFWVFVRDGADTLSAFYSVGRRGPAFLSGPGAIKFGVLAALVGGMVALFVG